MNDLLNELPFGTTTLVLGPPGTGKSTLLGSAAELGPTKLLALKPREANSWLYRKHGLHKTAELFHDPRWKPDLDKYEADAYLRLLRRLDELLDDDEHDVVLIDPWTDAVDLLMHELLKAEKAATPRESSDSRSIYGSFRQRMKNLVTAATDLAFAERPKHVLIACHTQAVKEDEEGHRGVTYEGEVLPAVEGSYRQFLAGDFDLTMYSTIQHDYNPDTRKRESQYRVEVRANPQRHSKIALGPALEEKLLPNHFPTVLRHVLEAAEAAV